MALVAAAPVCLPTLASAQPLIGARDVRIVGVQSVDLDLVGDSGTVLRGTTSRHAEMIS